MLTRSDVNTYNEQGYLVVPNVFSQKDINQLRAFALIRLLDKPEVEIIKDYPTIMYEPNLGRFYLQKVHDIANKIIGKCDRIMNQYYFHLQGDPDSFNWHTDSRFRPEVGTYLQTAIIVDNWYPKNGAVEFIPGSHKEDFTEAQLRGFKRNGLRGKMVIAKAGDVVVWSHKVVHASRPNDSDVPRAYYMQGFQ